jgi:hypothetical protein
VSHTCRRATFRINHEDRKTLRVGGWIGPRQGRRDIFADAIRIGLDVANVLLVEHGPVLERRRCDAEGLGGGNAAKT